MGGRGVGWVGERRGDGWEGALSRGVVIAH